VASLGDPNESGTQVDPGAEQAEARHGARAPRSAPETGSGTGGSIVRLGLYFYGGMGLVALAWRMWTPGESIVHPSNAAGATAWSAPAAIGVGLAAAVVTLALTEAVTRWTGPGRRLADALAERIGPLRRADASLLAFASGLAEEMFFRGALQARVGIVWASLLFGASHFVPRRELVPWSVYAAAMGFVFGGLYVGTGHLAAPIAAHVAINAVSLPRLAARRAAMALEPSATQRDRVDLDPGA